MCGLPCDDAETWPWERLSEIADLDVQVERTCMQESAGQQVKAIRPPLPARNSFGFPEKSPL